MRFAGSSRWARPPSRTPWRRCRRARGRSPSTATIRAERANATRRAVADLDEPYRETVALRFFGERSLEEIAAITGRPLGTVKTHLRRGLIRLRERVGGIDGPGGAA